MPAVAGDASVGGDDEGHRPGEMAEIPRQGVGAAAAIEGDFGIVRRIDGGDLQLVVVLASGEGDILELLESYGIVLGTDGSVELSVISIDRELQPGR